MTTDHGGIGNKHGGDSEPEVNVFLAIRGDGIKPGLKLDGEINNMDCAAVILKALGHNIPNWFDAKIPAQL